MVETPDAQIRQEVEQLLFRDSRTKDAVIDVGVMAGIVTLSGDVAKVGMKAVAEELAHSVVGVLLVNNELRVR